MTLGSVSIHRRRLEAKSKAKRTAEESKRKSHDAPFLKSVKYQRHGEKWMQYECSACGQDLHKTARFCVKCGAWFLEEKGTK